MSSTRTEWNFKEDGTMEVSTPIFDGRTDTLPEYISAIFKTPEMVRMQDISQNGYSSIDIPNLVYNTRWGHSIMVVQLVHPVFQKIRNILEEFETYVDQEEFEIAEAVFAAHDTGHTDNSHQSEGILKYSHEERTVDILLGDTEIAKILKERYPEEKIKTIVEIITQIDIKSGDVPKRKLSPFLQIYAQLVSSGLDLDKVAYTLGDTTFAGVKSSLDPQKLIDGFSINIDANGDFILQIDEDAQRQAEILDIERFQNYRDVYFNVSAEIMRRIEPVILELAQNEPEEIKKKLPESFLLKMQASQSDSRITNLKQELQMVDSVTTRAFKILARDAKNPFLRYLADINGSRRDYYFFETKRDISEIREQLQEIFQDRDLSQIKSLFEVESVCKMIKKSEDPWIKTKNGDLIPASEKDGCLIRPENFRRRRVFFNPEMLRLELGISKEEFEQHKNEIEWFLDGLIPRQDEFQLKYLLKDDSKSIQDFILFMEEHGFSLEDVTRETNADQYFDTDDWSLLNAGKEIRIRENTTAKGYKKSFAYKATNHFGEFSHRTKIEKPITNSLSVQTLQEYLKQMIDMEKTLRDDESIQLLQEYLEQLDSSNQSGKKSIQSMDVFTRRTNLLFEKNGRKVCISWDESDYNNSRTNKNASEVMLEYRNMGQKSDRLILKNIQTIMEKQKSVFQIYNGSKIARGTTLTTEQLDRDLNREKELKCQFKEKDRQRVVQILNEILQDCNILPQDEAEIKKQFDIYYDTPGYVFAHREESLRVRESKGEIVGTYKTEAGRSNNMLDREEKNIKLKENSTEALIVGARQQHDMELPGNIVPVMKVSNDRIKRNYAKGLINLELAIDKAMNTLLRTGQMKPASLGEFELEFKGVVDPQIAEQITAEIWNKLLRRCTQEGIMIRKSRHSKYVNSLIDFGEIEDKDMQK